jgi:1,4-dihydroxy-2-naphthoyl-CoA hydrolase
MFSITRRISLHDADAAGVLFFARYLAIAHDAFEEFMASRGISFRALLEEDSFILPVIHSECDYRLPLWVGDLATIEATIPEIKRRVFAIKFIIRAPDGRVAAEAKTVHAAVSKETQRAIPLPEKILNALAEPS